MGTCRNPSRNPSLWQPSTQRQRQQPLARELGMANRATTDAIQKDWKEREMIEVVHLNILKITKFLNEFEVSVRYKLSTLAERVGTLERHLEYCETAVKDKAQLQRFNSSSEPAPHEGR